MIQRWSKKTKTVRQKKREAAGKRKAVQQGTKADSATERIPRIKKNTLAKPPLATAKFKRRQVVKTWLPTHLWHAKRAHMTKPTEPLWRMSIPMSPTDKVYRPSHRASGARGCIAWDMSYMSTVSCCGTPGAIESLLKAFSFHGEGWKGPRYRRWRKGVRVSHGSLCERDGTHGLISTATVFWRLETPQSATSGQIEKNETSRDETEAATIEMADTDETPRKKKLKALIMIRIEPSAFYQFWLELAKVAKTQRPQVLVEDLRFEIGTIEITGPESTFALRTVLKPAKHAAGFGAVGETWTKLPARTSPASLPQNCLFGFNCVDPRLHFPPTRNKAQQDINNVEDVQVLVDWSPDQNKVMPDIFSHKRRYIASRAMLSQKAINRRRNLTSLVEDPNGNDSDPQIPVLLYPTRDATKKSQGSWTVLMPWMFVDAVWRCCFNGALPSGTSARFGGLDEKRQILFERQEPWFPADMPGSEAGQAWERTESKRRFDDWFLRPDGRRVAWHRTNLGDGRRGEHGNGWACDWEYLFKTKGESPPDTINGEVANGNTNAKQDTTRKPVKPPRLLTARQRKAAKALAETNVENDNRRRNTSSPESDASPPSDAPVKYTHLAPSTAKTTLKDYLTSPLPPDAALATVRISFLDRGTPQPCARIYRLPATTTKSPPFPTNNQQLRQSWLKLHSTLGPSHPSKPPYLPTPLKKERRNHHSLPRNPHHLPREYIDHITAIPPDAPTEIAEQFQAIPAPPRDEDAEYRKLFPKHDGDDDYPACPGEEDLIGFVTSGDFNLSLGRGAAVGSVWAQRVLAGWRREDEEREREKGGGRASGEHGEGSGALGGGAKGAAGVEKGRAKQREVERHLCIVRNAGEPKGRLARWEVWPGP